tara:strand:- start:304 stop:660 length:357 start_codon:yes stop_codon:yes gene_type:complete
MTDIATAIQSLNKKGGVNHEFVVRGEPTTEAEYNSNVDFVSGADANGTAIFSDTKPYTWSEVSAEKALLQTEYDNNEYQRKRADEYPSIADQLDDIYHNGIDGWKTTIKATKDKYPKS